MIERLQHVYETAAHAVTLIIDKEASVNPLLMLLGTVLYLVSQAIRTRGWHTILLAAYPPDAGGLRARDTCAAYLAGAGLNGVIPARGGDVAKLALLRRRIPGSTYPTLAATFIPESLFETTVGISLVVWALIRGFLPVPNQIGGSPSLDVSLIVEHPFISAVIAGTLAVALTFLWRWGHRRGAALVVKVRQGLAVFRRPRDFFLGVVPWQLYGRILKLGSLAAFMEAFSLPVTLTTVVLVMAAQGGGRIIPIGPASAGLRLAMLSYGFVEVTGQAVDIGEITAFTFGVGAVLAVAGLVLAMVILSVELGTLNPRTALRAIREPPPALVPPAATGR